MFLKALSNLSKQALVAFGLVVLPAGASLAAPVIAITGPTGSVGPGDTIVLRVTATDVVDLYAYQFTLNFDQDLFQAISVTEGPFLQGGGATFFDGGQIDNATGEISFVLGSLIGPDPGVSGSGILDTLEFRVIGGGMSSGVFTLSDVLVLNSNLVEIAVQTVGLTQQIPEPGSLLLVAAAAFAFRQQRGAPGKGHTARRRALPGH